MSVDSSSAGLKRVQQELRLTKKQKQVLKDKLTETKKDLERAEEELKEEI